MRYRFRTLQQSLFTYYSVVFIIFSLLVASLLYVFLANDIRSRSADQQKQLVTSIVSNMDQEIIKMNNLSMNIVYSNLVKEHFSHYLSLAEDEQKRAAVDPLFYKDNTTLIDVILAIISSSNTAQQANIYDSNGKMLGAGAFNGQRVVDLTQRPWYEETWRRNGWRVLQMLQGGSLPVPTASGPSEHRYLSLTRVYKDGNYVSQGVVEILQDAATVFRYPHELVTDNKEVSIYVLDEQDAVLYPFTSEPGQWSAIGDYYESLIHSRHFSPETMHEVAEFGGTAKQMMTYAVSPETGWTIIVTQSQRSLFAGLNQVTLLVIGATLATLTCILLISYLISKRVTLPLHRLQQLIRTTDAQALETGQKPGQLLKLEHPGAIRELDELNDTFFKLNQQLVQSFQDLLALKSEEAEARLLALQSQMNPHFLYNNIANISIMAEEGMNEEIVAFCGHITAMLRYISGSSKNGVPLSEELEYCERYLECMKIRFEDDLQYEFSIPEDMKNNQVPMLLIQPLLENTIKYGLRDTPPWRVRIVGEQDTMSNIWKITVEDNGPGMEPEAMKAMQDYIESSQDWQRMPNMRINGMGMKNIWIRLKLWYGDAADMYITNLPSGGVRVAISGSIRKESVNDGDDLQNDHCGG